MYACTLESDSLSAFLNPLLRREGHVNYLARMMPEISRDSPQPWSCWEYRSVYICCYIGIDQFECVTASFVVPIRLRRKRPSSGSWQLCSTWETCTLAQLMYVHVYCYAVTCMPLL